MNATGRLLTLALSCGLLVLYSGPTARASGPDYAAKSQRDEE